jgi:hypothetical protein
MAHTGDEDLAELITREQRAFRGILFAGLATLLVMVVMSAALGAYLYVTSQRLAETTRTLEQQAFDTRRNVEAQNNRLAAQEIAIRRAYQEIRGALSEAGGAITAEDVEGARRAARSFLFGGRLPTLSEQRALTQLAAAEAAGLSPAEKSLLAGVAALVGYETRGEVIPDDAEALPVSLAEALAAFEAAREDPALASLAATGIAWIVFEDASSGRSNYSIEACQRVFEAVDASFQEDVPRPQPLYWRAQCQRKVGMTSEALTDYTRSLRDYMLSAVAEDLGAGSRTELSLGMNAFHGVGTTLIASAAIPDDAPGMREALAIAVNACPPAAENHAASSPRMTLALACLDEAIRLRRELGQTENQLSGSAENMSFAHLRDGDIAAAYEHAAAVERTGLFPWNEVVRALTASRVSFDDPEAAREAAHAAADARRNVGMFRVSQFNLCELQALFDPETYEAARAIISEMHPGEEVECRWQ